MKFLVETSFTLIVLIWRVLHRVIFQKFGLKFSEEFIVLAIIQIRKI